MKRFVVATIGPSIYLLLTASLAALIAYPIFVLSGADNISFFRTLVSRGGQVILLLGLIPLWRWAGSGWESLGLSRRFPRQWCIGFVLGVMILGVHVFMLVYLQIRVFVGVDRDAVDLLPIMAKALGVGAGVALLEETIFRGAMVGLLRHLSGGVLAVMISAFYYSALHFVGTKWSTPLAQVGWDTGFRIALDGFAHLPLAQPDAFLGLFVAGLLLGALRVLKRDSLGICMGLHAGWVFVIKFMKPLSQPNPQSPYFHWVGSYDYFVGYLSSAWLVVLLVGLIALSVIVKPAGLDYRGWCRYE